jgi:hypothetical protein
MSHFAHTVRPSDEMEVSHSESSIELDGDQAAALDRFACDLDSVLNESSLPSARIARVTADLVSAYRSALILGTWEPFVDQLEAVLKGLADAGYGQRGQSSRTYARLRAIVLENSDLLRVDFA